MDSVGEGEGGKIWENDIKKKKSFNVTLNKFHGTDAFKQYVF